MRLGVFARVIFIKDDTIRFSIEKIIVLWLASASLLFSQSAVKITGRVVDAGTNEPLPGANVLVLGSAVGAATDASGRFELENVLNGHYTLKAAFIGYNPVENDVIVTDGQPAQINFQLERKVIELQGVEVTALAGEAPSSDIIVFSRRDIEKTQATSVGELLKYCPGVEIHDNGAQGEKKISIRGSRSNQVLVLLDGVKLNDELNGDVDLSMVPVNAVERVEVHKGGASAEYGGGAIGGLINIISASSSDDHLRLVAKTGSYGFQQVEPSVSAQWKNVNLLVSFQSQKSNGAYPFTSVQPDDLFNQQTRVNADVWSHNMFGRLGYSFKNHQVAVRYQSFESERGNPGRIHFLTPFARSSLKRDIWGADYKVAAKNWFWDTQFTYARHLSASSNLKPLESDVPFGSTPPFHFINERRTTHVKSTLQHNSAKWLSQRVGVEHRMLRFEDRNLLLPGSSAIGEAHDRVFAFFVSQDYHFLLSKLTLNLSPALRFDQARLHNGGHSREEQQWSPQLNTFMSYGGQHQIYIKTTIGRAFRMPTFADLFYQDFRVQGKADLLPEKSLNRDIGLGAHFYLMGEWRLDVTAFQNTIEDMIVWRLGSFEFFRPYNTDAKLLGEEYSLSWRTFADVLSVNGSYTHLRPLNKNENETLYNKFLPYRPEHSIKAGLELNVESWRSSLLYRHVGQRYVTEANTKSMPAYAVLDWTAQWTITLKKIKYQFQCAVLNVTNESYQIIRDMPLPGREWRLGLSVKY